MNYGYPNKENPSVENIVWGTAKENAEDRHRHGTTSRGEAHSAATKAKMALLPKPTPEYLVAHAAKVRSARLSRFGPKGVSEAALQRLRELGVANAKSNAEKRAPKSAEELSEIRKLSWKTRREKYGRYGHK